MASYITRLLPLALAALLIACGGSEADLAEGNQPLPSESTIVFAEDAAYVEDAETNTFPSTWKFDEIDAYYLGKRGKLHTYQMRGSLAVPEGLAEEDIEAALADIVVIFSLYLSGDEKPAEFSVPAQQYFLEKVAIEEQADVAVVELVDTVNNEVLDSFERVFEYYLTEPMQTALQH